MKITYKTTRSNVGTVLIRRHLKQWAWLWFPTSCGILLVFFITQENSRSFGFRPVHCFEFLHLVFWPSLCDVNYGLYFTILSKCPSSIWERGGLVGGKGNNWTGNKKNWTMCPWFYPLPTHIHANMFYW